MEFPNWKGGGGNRDTKTNNTQNTSRNTNLKTVTLLRDRHGLIRRSVGGVCTSWSTHAGKGMSGIVYRRSSLDLEISAGIDCISCIQRPVRRGGALSLSVRRVCEWSCSSPVGDCHWKIDPVCIGSKVSEISIRITGYNLRVQLATLDFGSI